MKKNWKTTAIMAFMVMFMLAFLPSASKDAQAAERVMTIHIKDGYNKTTSIGVQAIHQYEESYWFELEEDYFSILKSKEKENVQVSVEVNKPSLIIPESLNYEKEVTLTGTDHAWQTINFQYWSNGAPRDAFAAFYIYPYSADLKVESLAVPVSSKGFYPSKGNYLPIRSGISSLITNTKYGYADLRVRVNDSKGRYVYQKSFKNISGSAYLDWRWNGKASSKNAAKVKAGSYVKPGTYTVEVALSYSGNGYHKIAAKTKKIKVSKKAPKGTKGLAKAKQIPMFTGDLNLDYMAEKMVKEAGVKSGMSQNQKVKKIYHYMTTKFKHVHYGEKAPKPHFNVNKLRGQIASYRRSTDSNFRKGKLIYTYFRGVGEWNMARRCGVCNDHAAIFKTLCNHVGIDAGICGGYYKNRNGSLAPHAWNYAVVNGKTYYYDVDVEIQNYKGGQGDYYWYKKTKSQAKKNHKFL